jgi:hypothetical protein
MIELRAVQSVGRAVTERALGLGPGPIRAGVAATVVGVASATLTYRMLRDGISLGGTDEDGD